MKQVVTQAIVLARTNFQEADRIVTVLTPDQGKLRLLARGVRKSKSKMAGGIELFSVSEISFIRGKGDVSTLTSSRLIRHFAAIAGHIERTMLGYELIKTLNKVTEDQTESAYFDLLITTLEGLNNPVVSPELIQAWFDMQLFSISGHAPNLKTDTEGQPLQSSQKYTFHYDHMAFISNSRGTFRDVQIKVLRLLLSQDLSKLTNIEGLETQLPNCAKLVRSIRKHVLHI